MRSPRTECLLALLLAALACGEARGALAVEAAAPVASGASAVAALSPAQRASNVDAAVRQLRADPLISGQHKEHELQWKKDDAKKKKKPGAKLEPEPNWFKSFLDFLNDTSRFLFWGLVLVAVTVALVSGRHLIQLQGLRRRGAGPTVVSHVRDLDVRPESLPDDVGAAAWALWQAGQVQAALSLLYRGALSRLIHRHQVPITASATEGECLDLAQSHLEADAFRYVTQVVRAWQASIYGGRTLSLAMGESLCTGFATRFDAAPGAAAEAAA